MARFHQRAEIDAYRFYVADTLYFMANGKAPDKRLRELLNPPKEETRTAEEIIDSVKTKLERLVNK